METTLMPTQLPPKLTDFYKFRKKKRNFKEKNHTFTRQNFSPSFSYYAKYLNFEIPTSIYTAISSIIEKTRMLSNF